MGCSIFIKKGSLKGVACLSLRRISSKRPPCFSLVLMKTYCFTLDFHTWLAFKNRVVPSLYSLLPVVGDVRGNPLEGYVAHSLDCSTSLCFYLTSFLSGALSIGLFVPYMPEFTHLFPPRP